MAYKINTTRSGNSGVLKDGIYLLQVVDVEESVSQQSGNDMIVLKLAVVRNGRPSGRTIRDFLVFTEDAQFKFDQFHDALEVEEGKEITSVWYKGKKVYASLISEEYNGNVNNKVRTYLPPDVAKNLIEKQSTLVSDDGEISSVEDDTPVQRAAAQRGRPKRQQPSEMEEDAMPL